MENKLLQGPCGKIVSQGLAYIAFVSSLVYIAISFYPDSYPNMMRDWFNMADKVICIMISVMYFLTLYIKMQTIAFLLSTESILTIFIVVPILVFNDLSQLNSFYIFISLSRYLRIYYFCEVIRKYNDFGESDVDKHINKISMLVASIVLVAAGLYMETENQQNLLSIDYDFVKGGDHKFIGYEKIDWE